MWIMMLFSCGAVIVCSCAVRTIERKNAKERLEEQIEQYNNLRETLKNERKEHYKLCKQIIAEDEDNMNKQKKEYESKIKELQEHNESLQNGLDMYKEQQRRALILHPDLETEIDRMIKEEIIRNDIEKANEFDKIADEVIHKSASRYIVDELREVFDAYNKLTNNQKGYVVTDIEKLSYLYKASLGFYNAYLQRQEEEKNKQIAINTYNQISTIVANITFGTRHNLQQLNVAMRLYKTLSDNAKQYFDNSIMKKVEELMEQAKFDQRNYVSQLRMEKNTQK